MKQLWRAEDISPLGLAFIGDAIWEIYARNHCLNAGVRKPRDLHLRCTRYVAAAAQAEALKMLEPVLNEAELEMVRRGRNQKSAHVRRNVDVLVYRYSTGFEALIGYLHATDQIERLHELAALALAYLDEIER
ncbi:mini-ribonuclease 3 [Alicyclobacillus hesperidum subsp. aegles]|uniref:Mini-ribonuclease 3 n=1 Tax=Alicyclobacillus hesperidum TaxID=89784 RepID=UPI000719283B|nr:ribonuclease III domain-containing protein [Alicyclobacillus hesperidum]KRW91196.1 ribonuclease III [Alicyclobacillus tengchongensis]GLG02576.1 mini-ribonuclease 3 [Alicyclobacillus hesperidum subsp. aegles]